MVLPSPRQKGRDPTLGARGERTKQMGLSQGGRRGGSVDGLGNAKPSLVLACGCPGATKGTGLHNAPLAGDSSTQAGNARAWEDIP